jgi:hypothetical protein
LKRLLTFALVVAELCACSRTADPDVAQPKREVSEKSIRVLVDSAGIAACLSVTVDKHAQIEEVEELDWIVFAAWEDGTVVWSNDQVSGGRPLSRSKLEPSRLAAALREVSDAVGHIDLLNREHFGFDSTHTVISAHGRDGWVKLASWHEPAESNPNLVALDWGLVPVDARGREAMLAASKPEYRQFRSTWSDVRGRIAALIPATGEPCDGSELRFEWISDNEQR